MNSIIESIPLTEGVETTFHGQVYPPDSSNYLGAPDLDPAQKTVLARFDTTLLQDAFDASIQRMLTLPTSQEGASIPVTSRGRGPIPLFNGSHRFANLVNFVQTRGPRQSHLIGYRINPNHGGFIFEDYTVDSEDTSRVLEFAHAQVGETKGNVYPQDHPKAGKAIKAATVMLQMPESSLGDPTTVYNVENFASSAAYLIKRTVLNALADSDRVSPIPGKFGNLFHDRDLHAVFENVNRT